MNPKWPNPGVHYGIAEDVYRKLPAVNISSLLTIDEYSPAHYLHQQSATSAQTDAQAVGSASHCHVLTPDLFNGEYAVGPDCDRRNKEWKEFAKANPGRKLLKGKEYEVIHGVSKSATELDTLGILDSGWSEVSMVWVDPVTGILCKGRLDHLTGLVILDLKTTKDARLSSFEWDYWKYHYFVKAAWYVWGLFHASMQGPDTETIQAESFHIFAVEKNPPYAGIHYRCHEVDLIRGEAKFEIMMQTLKTCMDTGVWPAYPKGVQTLRIPAAKRPAGYEIFSKYD